MMVVLLSIGFALGADPRKLALLAVTVLVPQLILVAGVAAVWLSRRRSDPTAALFCEGVASELRAGATLRDAIAATGTFLALPKLADHARNDSLSRAAAEARVVFPTIARELETTITRVADSGGAAADLFDEIAALALAQEEIRREVLVASAPARAATGLFVVLPAGYLLYRWTSGGLADLAGSSVQVTMTVIGLGLFLVGLAVAVLLVWKSR